VKDIGPWGTVSNKGGVTQNIDFIWILFKNRDHWNINYIPLTGFIYNNHCTAITASDRVSGGQARNPRNYSFVPTKQVPDEVSFIKKKQVNGVF